MTTITIRNLNIAGSDLFIDTESYIEEISDEEFHLIGGLSITFSFTLTPLTKSILNSTEDCYVTR